MKNTKKSLKTYILKYNVHNNVTFPVGTIVSITDDYFPYCNDTNTGFTVVSGKLKGQKGCVANGLKKYLLENTDANKNAIKLKGKEEKKHFKCIDALNKQYDKLKTQSYKNDVFYNFMCIQ